MTDLVPAIPTILTKPCDLKQVEATENAHGKAALTKFDIIVTYLAEDIGSGQICDVYSWKIVDNRWLRISRIDYTASEIDFVRILSVTEINPVGNY